MKVAVHMSGRTAITLRYLLPILAEGLRHAKDDGQAFSILEQAVADVDRALPPELRGAIDDHKIAEYRMDAIEKQREAGVRPPAPNAIEEAENG